MLKFLSVLVTMVACLMTVFVVWYCYVPAVDESALVSIRAAAEQRIQTRDQTPAAENGYPEVVAILKASQADNPYEILNEYDELLTWNDEDPHARTKKSMLYLKDLQAHPEWLPPALALLDKVWPQLRQAMAKPAFIWPSTVIGHQAGQYWLVNDLESCMEVHGRLAERHHDYAEAADDYLAMLRWGQLISLNDITGLWDGSDLQTYCLARLDRLMASGHLKTALLRHIAATLDALPHNDLKLADRCDEEYVYTSEALQSAAEAGVLKSTEDRVFKVGISDRPFGPFRAWLERRLVDWYFLRYRPCATELKTPAALDLDVDADREFLIFRDSMVARYIVSPECARYIDQLEVFLAADRLVAALETWHADKGTWPPSLAALVPAYISKLPTNLWAADGQFTYRIDQGHALLEFRSPISSQSLQDPTHQFLPFRYASDFR